MGSDAGVGDVETPYLDVQPGDNTTTGSLTVTAPDGTTSSPAVTAGAPQDMGGGVTVVRLTAAPVTYNAPGRWVLGWQVTGTGTGAEVLTVQVVSSPTAGGPAWVPGRSRVANYIPGRTLATDADTHQLTFDSRTVPSGIMVDRLVADAVTWVTSATGTVSSGLYDLAGTVAAIWAAAAVERGYPEEEQVDAALRRANDLLSLATSMRADLVRANDASSGTPNPTDPASQVRPVWSFPPPVPWGDSYL
jgi:hypothetical protein